MDDKVGKFTTIVDKLNAFFIRIAYLPLFSIVMCLFLIINLVLLPCTYIVNVIILSSKWISNKKVGFKFIIKWIFVGIFWLSYRLIIETYEFIFYLMEDNDNNKTEENT